jgi:hypothetical protein
MNNAHYSLVGSPEGALEETRVTMKDIAVIKLNSVASARKRTIPTD